MTSVKAIYERGKVRLLEPVPSQSRQELIVIFLEDMDAGVPLKHSATAKKKNGWPAGYFNRTAGCLRNNPIQRAPEGDFERRKVLR